MTQENRPRESFDANFEVLLEEDVEWTLLELDYFELLDKDIENANEHDADSHKRHADYTDIDEEILKDPVKLLKWLEQREDFSV